MKNDKIINVAIGRSRKELNYVNLKLPYSEFLDEYIKNTKYTKAITRKMLVAAVTRIFKPGTKFDNMMVLVGKQGIGKSYLISLLGKN